MRRRSLLSGVSLLLSSFAPARAQSVLGTPAAPAGPNLQAPKLDDTVGAGYQRIVIARWGDGVLPDAPPFNPHPLDQNQAATQFPYDAMIAGLIPPPPAQDGIPRLVMVLANPDAPARMVFPGGVDVPAVAGKLQGATVMNLQYFSGRWVVVDGGYQSRRLTDGTLCQISGPAAAAIGDTVQGLLAPQGGCATPWGTVLFVEGDAAPWLTRLANTDYGYGDPTEAPKFGWVVELNPLDPGNIPVKRTALGRFARAAIAATATPDGRPVIFMSQDAPDGMLFRFIAATNATDGTALDSGTLAVAQIRDNQITWINLGADVPSLVGALSAAGQAGGSPFDAPCGIALATDGSGTIYLACRGNKARQPEDTNALNPRAGDDNGHIIAFHPPHGDPTASTFDGEIAVAAGNPATAQFTQYTPGSATWITKPRTLNLDSLGQLWIGTDQGGKKSDTADGLFIMQTGGPSKYLVTTAYLAPVGAAIGGAAFDAATKTIFGMVRHPGATPESSFDNPATRWPTLQPNVPPQSTVIGLVGG
jgi:secreted PhoX family phosphatase